MKNLFLIIIAFLFITGTNAQDDNFRTKIEKIKVEKLVKKLELDEATEDVFVQKYKTFRQTIRDLNKARAKIMRQIEKNIDNNEVLDTLIDRMLEVEQEITTQRKNYAEDLKSYLTPKQIATMIIFERNFALELRRILRENRKK
jgi:septal ring factor EnvC (AmiA/AmiB activator)